MGKARNWFVSEAKRVGVNTVIGCNATAEIIESYAPDAVILATGSLPFIPGIPGKEKALEAWNVLQGKETMKDGTKVAIIGGVVGMELAHKLINEGYHVTVIDMLPDTCGSLEPMHKEFLETFVKKNATVCLNTRVKEIAGDKVICETAEGILSVTDAERAVEAGAVGIVLSHHHGVFPFAVPPALLLPEIRRAVGKDISIIVDCGIRNGSDAFKALALGADGVGIARGMQPALKKAGEEGVYVYFKTVTDQLRGIMARTGTPTVSAMNPTVIHRLR